MPPRKYHPAFPSTSYDPRSFSPSLPYLLYWFNIRDRENSFRLGFVIPLPCALFVDSHPLGGVSSFIPHLRSGSTLLLTSRVHFSPPVVVYGLNRPYQSSLYRLNPNPPSTITLLYHAVVPPCQAVMANGSFTHHQFITKQFATPCHSGIVSSYIGLAYNSSPVLERTSALQYSNFSLALCVASCSRILSRRLHFTHQFLLVTSPKPHQRRRVSRSSWKGVY